MPEWFEYLEDEPFGEYCKKCGDICMAHADPEAGDQPTAMMKFGDAVVKNSGDAKA